MNTLAALVAFIAAFIFGRKAADEKPAFIGPPEFVGPPKPDVVVALTRIQRGIAKQAAALQIDLSLALAIAEQESNFNPSAVNPRDPSYGLFQVLCAGPDRQGFCTNRLPAFSDWPAHRDDLMDPETNTMWGLRILQDNLKVTRGDESKALEIYNGGPRAVGSAQTREYARQVLERRERWRARLGGAG